jgi:hypothetical protein
MLEDFVDFQNEHEDYILLMEEYSNTELFKETILFLDIAFPEWKTNNGVGSSAAEFVLNIMNENENLAFEDSFSKDKFKELYEDIVFLYKVYKENFKSQLLTIINNKVNLLYEEEFEILENDVKISAKDYLAYCNVAKEKFKEIFMDKITYDFINPIL